MTDGIIQQVIRKYTFDPLYIISNYVRLDLLEQELIEKIKQEFDNELTWEGYRAYNNQYLKAVENWKKAIIGDNKE